MPSKRLLPDKQVCLRYGVTQMTLWRWTNDASLGFPQPIKIRKRPYRDLDELEEFDERQRDARPILSAESHDVIAPCLQRGTFLVCVVMALIDADDAALLPAV